MGHRIDNRFKITPKSKMILQIEIKNLKYWSCIFRINEIRMWILQYLYWYAVQQKWHKGKLNWFVLNERT
jgi:hypothetical protein